MQIPYYFKHAIDALHVPVSQAALDNTLTAAGTMLVACKCFLSFYVLCVVWDVKTWHSQHRLGKKIDGAARIGSSVLTELRTAVFARVAQDAIRSVARSTFEHLHALDLSFHVTRQTGALQRTIDRGTRYVSFLALFFLA